MHKQGDTRCFSSGFECPMCGRTFETTRNLQDHIEGNHEQESSLSLISEASSGWMDDTNNAKGNGSFGEKLLSENEDLVTQNLIEDNYETESSLEELLIEDEFENTSVFHTQKKFVQNLKDINFEEDSDDDNEWNPNEEEDEENEEAETYCCNSCSYTKKT